MKQFHVTLETIEHGELHIHMKKVPNGIQVCAKIGFLHVEDIVKPESAKELVEAVFQCLTE